MPAQRSRFRFALSLLAAALLTLRAAPAAAQAVQFREGAGAPTAASLAADGFSTLYSFRLTGFSVSHEGPALYGGTGDCLPGAACQTSTGTAHSGAVVPGAGATYHAGTSWFPMYGMGPHFGVVNPGMSEAHLELSNDGLAAGTANAFYIVLRGGSAGSLRITDARFAAVSADVNKPVAEHGVTFDQTVGPGATRFAAFRLKGDMSGALMFDFAAITEGLGEGDTSPEIDVYVGRVTTTPEPASLALLGAGVAALGGVVLRRRRDGRG